jgi:hypothetical protein
MAIKEVIQAINQMQADGVIERYAVGGAVGATFYLEEFDETSEVYEHQRSKQKRKS